MCHMTKLPNGLVPGTVLSLLLPLDNKRFLQIEAGALAVSPTLHKISWGRDFLYFISVFSLPNLQQLHWSPNVL